MACAMCCLEEAGPCPEAEARVHAHSPPWTPSPSLFLSTPGYHVLQASVHPLSVQRLAPVEMHLHAYGNALAHSCSLWLWRVWLSRGSAAALLPVCMLVRRFSLASTAVSLLGSPEGSGGSGWGSLGDLEGQPSSHTRAGALWTGLEAQLVTWHCGASSVSVTQICYTRLSRRQPLRRPQGQVVTLL